MRALVDEDKTKDKDASDQSSSSSDNFKQFHIKAPKMEYEHKNKLFYELLGCPVDS